VNHYYEESNVLTKHVLVPVLQVNCIKIFLDINRFNRLNKLFFLATKYISVTFPGGDDNNVKN